MFRRGLSGFLRPSLEETQRERNFIGISRTPGNNSFEFYRVVLNRANFHQFCFDYLFVSSHFLLNWRELLLTTPPNLPQG